MKWVASPENVGGVWVASIIKAMRCLFTDGTAHNVQTCLEGRVLVCARRMLTLCCYDRMEWSGRKSRAVVWVGL